MADQGKQKKSKKLHFNLALYLVELSLAIITLAIIYYGGYYLCEHIPIPESMDFASRLAYTFRWSLPMVIVFMITIMNTANKRGSSAAVNPLSGNEHLVQSLKNILMNTHEQLMAAFMLMLILVTYCDTPDTMKIIPLYVISYTVGRILFIIGYSIGPQYRSYGMMMNLISTFGLAGYIVYLVYTKGMMYGLGTAYAPAVKGLGNNKPEL